MEHEKKRVREAIREQYGLVEENSKKKKRITKPNDKSRFSADWDNSEDTTRIDPLYQEAQLLFGSGYFGGVDRRLQKNESRLRKKSAVNLYDSRDKHWTHKVFDEMTDRDWRIFKEDFNISYKGSRAPKPIRSWKESNLSPELLKAVARSGFKTPSPIQMAAIPLGLQKRDLIGIAETGSGKTAAFVLPLLTFISKLTQSADDEKEPQGPFAVILAPTRELAQQIEEQILKLAAFMKPVIKVTSIVGGQSIQNQGFKIGQGCDVVIATPGRLIDCLERRYVSLNQCNFVVLDEADRMIDLGFEGQVISVLDYIDSHRTTFMFSATMAPSVERLAKKLLKNPVIVTVGKTAESITQNILMMKESEKIPKLRNLIRDIGDRTVIVFVNTRKTADFVSKNLDKTGINVVTFHGGKSQDQRETSLGGFRSGRYNVLVATDVAARGIDVADVAHVVNYDMCVTIETYMHRIGRTGRAGKMGEATTFLTVGDSDVFSDLKEVLIRSKCRVPAELARHEASRFKPRML